MRERRYSPGRRSYDPPPVHGSPDYWRKRRGHAEDLIKEGGKSVGAGLASLREIASAMRERKH